MKWMVPIVVRNELREGRGVCAPAITHSTRPAYDPSVATSLVDDVYLSLVAILVAMSSS